MAKESIHYAPIQFMEPVHHITVAVIGVGGTGSNVLLKLAKMDHALRVINGYGLDVTVFDPDIVSESNVGRQAFSDSDIGLYKSNVLVSRTNRYFGTEWKSRPCKFKSVGKGYNIIISCVDNVASRKDVKTYFNYVQNKHTPDYEKMFYWLDLGNGSNYGQFVLGSNYIKQPKSKQYKCIDGLPTIFDLYPDLKDEADDGPSCSMEEALRKQDLFTNSFIAEAGMTLLWQLLFRYRISYHGAYVNLGKMKVVPIKL